MEENIRNLNFAKFIEKKEKNPPRRFFQKNCAVYKLGSTIYVVITVDLETILKPTCHFRYSTY